MSSVVYADFIANFQTVRGSHLLTLLCGRLWHRVPVGITLSIAAGHTTPSIPHHNPCPNQVVWRPINNPLAHTFAPGAKLRPIPRSRLYLHPSDHLFIFPLRPVPGIKGYENVRPPTPQVRKGSIKRFPFPFPRHFRRLGRSKCFVGVTQGIPGYFNAAQPYQVFTTKQNAFISFFRQFIKCNRHLLTLPWLAGVGERVGFVHVLPAVFHALVASPIQSLGRFLFIGKRSPIFVSIAKIANIYCLLIAGLNTRAMEEKTNLHSVSSSVGTTFNLSRLTNSASAKRSADERSGSRNAFITASAFALSSGVKRIFVSFAPSIAFLPMFPFCPNGGDTANRDIFTLLFCMCYCTTIKVCYHVYEMSTISRSENKTPKESFSYTMKNNQVKVPAQAPLTAEQWEQILASLPADVVAIVAAVVA